MSVFPNVEPQDRLGACLATCNTLGRILDSVSDGISEHAFVLCRGHYFGLDDLPDEIGRARISDELLDLDALAEENVERHRILSTLKSAGGLSEAARQLGISRTTLWRKLKRIQRVAE